MGYLGVAGSKILRFDIVITDKKVRAMDAVGLLGRDLQSFHSFVQLTVRNDSGNIKQVRMVRRLILPTN